MGNTMSCFWISGRTAASTASALFHIWKRGIKKYKDYGLVIVGLHAPEFEF